MKKIFGLLFISNVLFSQNLVLNPSFEDRSYNPDRWMAPDNFKYFEVKNWSQTTVGTVDVLTDSTIKELLVAGPKTASSGNTFVGIIPWHPKKTYREYFTGELSEPLEKGKTYVFKMKISTGNKCPYFVDQLGVYFSKDRIQDTSTNKVLNKPNQVSLDVTGLYDADTSWIEIQSTYVASGEEKYFTIGNFKDDCGTKMKYKNIPSYVIPFSYIYIDDISVEPASTTSNVLIFKDIQFDFNKSTLKPESYMSIHTVAAKLKQDPTLRVTINGYTDSVGTESYNKQLSKNRAKVVADYLISLGISKNRISYNGYGTSNPISSDPNINRRVEFVFN